MTALPPLPAQPKDTHWPTYEWPRGEISPSADANRLIDLVDRAFDPDNVGSMGETHAFIAIQAGRMVLERYAGGDHTTGATFPSWSMAKSITQLLIGFLVAEGRIDPTAPIPVP